MKRLEFQMAHLPKDDMLVKRPKKPLQFETSFETSSSDFELFPLKRRR
jgi:hypothetical protein